MVRNQEDGARNVVFRLHMADLPGQGSMTPSTDLNKDKGA